jgi:transcriptional regulator with XRE-family HTH domain
MEKSLFSEKYALLLRELRAARKSAGVTQEELAAALKTTQSVVSKCERGERRLDVIELRTWCHTLDISFTEFLVKFDRALNKRRAR